jgi:asparagine synthase (glutamine-hydrolysing)
MIGVLFSGGKDSCLALGKALEKEKVCLISIISKNPYSYMFHTANIEIVKIQAKAMELPIMIKKTKGEKEIELEDLKKVLVKAKEKYGIHKVYSGAIGSNYQKERIEKVCKEVGLECHCPLWNKQKEELIKEYKEKKINAIISGIFAWPFQKEILGKNFFECLDVFEKNNINVFGEGGEFETTVLDALFFKKRIKVVNYEILGEENSWVYKIKKVRLVNKDE